MSASPQPVPPAGASIPLPNSRWAREYRGDTLRLSRSWSTPFLWCFAPFACSFAIPLVSSNAWGGSTSALVTSAVFFLIFSYPVLVFFVNSTRIELMPLGLLRIRHGPLPSFTTSRTVPAREITQLWCRELEIPDNRRPSYHYELYVQRSGGTSHQLLGNSMSYAELFFVKRALEEHLGIEDRPVAGEYRPGG